MAVFPVIPQTVTVHLGPPDAPAEQITLPFPDYIKNVASGELYPTWPENALRANIYAQISFTLNRIYTEFYRSRGYDFDITSDTTIDQTFTRDRDIFENISRLTDELFTSYLRRTGSIEPLPARYCNGTTSTCPGLSQWGTVTLAEQGQTPIDILRYYYSPDVEIVSNTPVQGIPFSPPLSPLTIGSSGDDVLAVQLRLNRISLNYPAIPKIPSPRGFYDQPTAEAASVFQRIFDLAQDGVVGRDTWYRILYVYNSVKRLSELDSEGLRASELANRFPGSLAIGDSGIYVADLQVLLSLIGQYDESLPPVTVDGIYGEQTARAVAAVQESNGLAVTGVTDEATYERIFALYTAIARSLPPVLDERSLPPYPGAPLVTGSSSPAVSALQEGLNELSVVYPSLGTLAVSGIYDDATAAAVRELQRLFGIPVSGIVGGVTWQVISRALGDLGSESRLQNRQYPGFAPGEGASI